MPLVCLIHAEVPGWLGRRLEEVSSLFPNLSEADFFIQALDLGLTAMVENSLDDNRGGDDF